jgi:hypothetical protein
LDVARKFRQQAFDEFLRAGTERDEH